MTRRFLRRLRALPAAERGQVLPLVAVMMMVLMGIAGFTIDVGRAMMGQRQLQAAADAAALAGAQALPASAVTNAPATADPIAAAKNYSALEGKINLYSNLPTVTMPSGYPKLKCLTTLSNQGMACVTPTVGSGAGIPANAIQVVEQTAINTYFAAVIGFKSFPVSATATASMRGGGPSASNVAVIVDTTLSMNITDANCSNLTQEQCALNGVQILLNNLYPCGITQKSCGAATSGNVSNSFDRVALFTFPNVSVSTVHYYTSCPTPVPNNGKYYYQAPYGAFTALNETPAPSLPVALPYSFPMPGAAYAGLSGPPGNPTYQVTPFQSDYRTSDSASTLNSSSGLVMAAGALSGCSGLVPPNFEADYETYYAGAIYAAQSALVAEQTAFPGSQNVIIILSDGDSNALQQGGALAQNTGYPNMNAAAPSGNYMTASASGTYPSWVGECKQAVTAAQAASNAGTLVFSVAYGAEPTGCATDTNPAMRPCDTMAGMATASQYFFSDQFQSGSNSNCVSPGQPNVTSLAQIFQAIGKGLTQARLIPNGTT